MVSNLALPGFGDPASHPEHVPLSQLQMRIVTEIRISNGLLVEEVSRLLSVSQKTVAHAIATLVATGVLCYAGDERRTRSGRKARVLALDPTHLATRFLSNDDIIEQQPLIEVAPPTVREHAAALISQGIVAGLSAEEIADQILALPRTVRS